MGKRVAGIVHGGLYRDRGSLAQFVVVEPDLTYNVPPNISNSEAATSCVSAITAMQALKHTLGAGL